MARAGLNEPCRTHPFDGDMMAVQIMQTEDARNEIKEYLSRPESVVSLSGQKLISVGVDTIDLVLKALLTNVG